MRRVAVLVALALVAAGCRGGHGLAADPSVQVAPHLPRSAATWPDYPAFARHSCWARSIGGGVLRYAPSSDALRPASPQQIVQRVVAGLGDRRFVRRVELAAPPPRVLRRGNAWFLHALPPRDSLWAYIAAPASVATLPAHPSQRQLRDLSVAEWEVGLVEGALRDEFCAAGGPPLVGWTVSGVTKGVSDQGQAFGQRFPNPSPAVFRARAARVGKRYGFRVDSLRLLHPSGLAPLLVVSTDRDRRAFVKDVPAIMKLLDPIASGATGSAVTFEGFLLEARDSKGPFVRLENLYRGQSMGGEWSWARCWYPYPHSEPVGAKPCPPGSTG